MPRQKDGRALRRNHSNAIPRYIISVSVDSVRRAEDSEGKKYSHSFLSATVIYGRIVDETVIGMDCQWFTNKEDVWKWIISKTGLRHTLWCVSQDMLGNLVMLDFQRLFTEGELTTDSPRAKRERSEDAAESSAFDGLCILDSPPTIIGAKAAATQGRIVFLDTYNYFPMQLDDTKEQMLDRAIKHGWFEFPAKAYCTSGGAEARTTFRAFVELAFFIQKNDLGMFRYTSAGQAMAAYRHRYMPRKLYLHNNKEVKAIERQGYFGGRTEVFKIGKFTASMAHLDCNSLFPSVMAKQYFPFLLDYYELYSEYKPQLPVIDWSASIAEVELNTDEPAFPLRLGGRIMFPTGHFKTVLAGPELQYAFYKGYIVACRGYAQYKLDRIFESWVSDLWQMRLRYKMAGDTLYDTFTKRLMNSLYGKFGQQSQKWVNCKDAVTLLPWSQRSFYNSLTRQITLYRSFGWQLQKKQEKQEIPNSFVAVSSFVTAYARRRMDMLRATAGVRNVYYQGVDCLIVTMDGLANLDKAGEVQNGTLGKLRLEGITESGAIHGASDYRFGSRVAIGGCTWAGEHYDESTTLARKYDGARQLFKGCDGAKLTETNYTWTRANNRFISRADQEGWISSARLGDVSESSDDPANGEAATADARSFTASNHS